MLATFVGLLHQFLHQVVLLHLPFAGQADYLGAVVILSTVVHLVVHPRLLTFQHLFGKTHAVYHFGHGQFCHLFQRVEDVHNQQVLLCGFVQPLHIGLRLVRQRVVVGMLRLHFPA